jgi:hypothetical protein
MSTQDPPEEPLEAPLDEPLEAPLDEPLAALPEPSPEVVPDGPPLEAGPWRTTSPPQANIKRGANAETIRA